MSLKSPLARIVTLAIIIIMLLAGVFSTTNTINPQQGSTPTNVNPSTPVVVFPAVPAGGTPVIADRTYIHPTALFAMPHFEGWDLAQTNGEETVEPTQQVKITRAGATFINAETYSVVHAFVEKDPDRKQNTLGDLNAYYTKENLNGAWSNFTGGWEELNRGVVGDWYVVNVRLKLDTNTYLGRQVSRINDDWLMTMRLVAPDNNPQLLDTLQNAVASRYQFLSQGLNAPLRWGTIADYIAGYIIRFPPEWRILDGSAGHPFTVSGPLGQSTITMITRMQRGKLLASEDDARAFVQENWSNAKPQTIKAITGGSTNGYVVSYNAPDADGNPRSAIVTIYNVSPDRLYVANLQSSTGGKDLLDPADTSNPVELTQVRNSFFLLPVEAMVATPTIVPLEGTQPVG